MNWQQVKKAMKGANTVYWRGGADTVSEITPRRAHSLCNESIMYDDECDVAQVVVIGDIAFVDEKSWVEWHGQGVA